MVTKLLRFIEQKHTLNNMDQVYTPEIVQETPFPGANIQLDNQTQGNTTNYTPTVSKENALPLKKFATELLSTTLNTRSRKILQEFALQQSGGLQIGDFKEGISGDIRLTPNGITGRDIAGITKFAIDTDGNAVFAGEIRSGSEVTGSVSILEGGYLVIGNSIFIGDFASL